jgi:hypothetical protein
LEENGKKKRGGMTGKISFRRGEDIYLFKNIPTPNMDLMVLVKQATRSEMWPR